MSITKGEIVTAALKLLRISGLTRLPQGFDLDAGKSVLESTMGELYETNTDVNFSFSDSPSTNQDSGIARSDLFAVSCVLAERIALIYGKKVLDDPTFMVNVARAHSYLASKSAITRQVQMPRSMPVGSGNRPYAYNRNYFDPATQVPLSAKSNVLRKYEVEEFIEDFDSKLANTEDISSFTIEASTGLTVVSSAKSSSNKSVEYTVRADGFSYDNNEALVIKIVVTTTESNKIVKPVYFQILPEVTV